MIPVTPNSKPIECSEPEEGLAVAYSIFRQVRFFLQQPDPSAELRADVEALVREFCAAYEQRVTTAPPKPETDPELAALEKSCDSF